MKHLAIVSIPRTYVSYATYLIWCLFCLQISARCLAANDVEALKTGLHKANCNGAILSYRVSGKGPICIVPSGTDIGCDLYARTMKPIENCFAMVYVDMRATGKSSRPEPVENYSWDTYANDLDALRKHLGLEQAWFLGHDLGGCQVLSLARQNPNVIKGLITICTPGELGSDDGDQILAGIKRKRARDKGWDDVVSESDSLMDFRNEEELKRFFFNSMKMTFFDFRVFEKYKEDFASVSPAWHVEFRATKLKVPKIAESLNKCRAPAMIIACDEDIACSIESALPPYKHLPNSKFLLVRDCGHFPWLERRDRFFQGLKAFLREQSIEEQKTTTE